MAMIQSNHEINIAMRDDPRYPHYRHWALMELGPISKDAAIEKFRQVCRRFPVDEGWQLSLKHIECVGREIAKATFHLHEER